MAKKTLTVAFRVEEEFQKRLEAVAVQTQIDASSLGRAALEAVVKYIEEHKEVTFPMHVITKQDKDTLDWYKENVENS